MPLYYIVLKSQNQELKNIQEQDNVYKMEHKEYGNTCGRLGIPLSFYLHV